MERQIFIRAVIATLGWLLCRSCVSRESLRPAENPGRSLQALATFDDPRSLETKNLPEFLSTSIIDNDYNPSDYVGPTFVFVMGVEGAGHNLLRSLLGQSPNMLQMKQLGMCDKDDHNFRRGTSEFLVLSRLLFGDGNGGMRNPYSVSLLDNGSLHDHIVDTLSRIRRRYNEEKDSSLSPTSLNIAINANGCRVRSPMPYPTFMGPDRPMHYFNLELFYNACQDAQVRCRHVYIYRNPYNVIRSTRSRDYYKNIRDSVQFFTHALEVVHSQMASYANRTLGCFGFRDADGFQLQDDWERFSTMFGWDSKEELMAIVQYLNRRIGNPVHMTDGERENLVPQDLVPLMKVFMDNHHRAADLCYQSLQPVES